MKRWALLMAVLAVGLSAWAQTSAQPAKQNAPVRKSPLAAYVGTWTGSFEARTWITVRLTLQGEQLTGSIQRPRNVQFNDQGEIKGISDEQSTEQVENAQINGDGLLITVKDPDKPETDRFLIRLTGDTTAEIKMLAMSMPPGMPKLKPWKLTKFGANAGQAAR
jgi:hypothetical protein